MPFAITSTFLYFQQAGIVSRSFHDRGAQTAFFASVDLAVNVLTLFVQLFLTGRIVRAAGVGPTLAFLPALTIVGFGALALVPTLASLVAFQVLRRSGDYAVARPTREVLYTVVAREDRYKAKSFIDTVVYRGGDQVGAWSFTFLTWPGFGTIGIAIAAGCYPRLGLPTRCGSVGGRTRWRPKLIPRQKQRPSSEGAEDVTLLVRTASGNCALPSDASTQLKCAGSSVRRTPKSSAFGSFWRIDFVPPNDRWH